MTPAQIETHAERWMDRIDRRLMSGAMTESAYKRECEEIARWVEQAYAGGMRPGDAIVIRAAAAGEP